jgi:hypothetical protein
MGAGATRRPRLAAALLVLALLAGCSYNEDEPGLFGRGPAAESPEAGLSADTPESGAAIPVLGEATWTTVDPPDISVRFAIHGVRRVPGGTVLDWSVTALGAPGGVPGERVPGGLRLGIYEPRDVLLVDARAGRIYRPLVSRDGSNRCLCAPAELAEEDLALDESRLLQVAYPELPESTRVIDVSVAPVPIFSRIPVTPVGQVAAPIAKTDLARPVEPPGPAARTADFTLPSGQRFAIEVNTVLASGTTTSVVWSLEVLSQGPGPGPGLLPELTRNDAWRVTPMRLGPTQRDGSVCLCLDPAAWRKHLEEPGRRVTVVTVLGEIPLGTTTVDVLFPKVPPLHGIRVTPASDGAYRSAGTVRAPQRSWSYRTNRPLPGWGLYAWPTPPPEITKGDFSVTVDPILD